jgi:tRNA (adenine57-N1/adenine58-N1)-methyltransferase
LLIDRRNRRYLITLKSGSVFHTHMGTLRHDQLIGQEEGCWLRTSYGMELLALRPTLSEYTLEMPRATQVVYPKDLGAILMEADIFPGATVVEAGLGSGALTLALLRAVGSLGKVVSYDLDEALISKTVSRIKAFTGDVPNLVVKLGDVYQGIAERDIDRLVLDLPEPWRAVPHAPQSLKPGGILISLLPTALQVHQLAMALEAEPRFTLVRSFEMLMRTWHVSSKSLRPDHRMVAHTAFLVTARRCHPRGAAARPDEPNTPSTSF